MSNNIVTEYEYFGIHSLNPTKNINGRGVVDLAIYVAFVKWIQSTETFACQNLNFAIQSGISFGSWGSGSAQFDNMFLAMFGVHQ